jgi:hemerythrin superfamily protein
MAFSLFLSKNQKLVKQWTKEHKKVVILATNVIESYQSHRPSDAKVYLSKLNHLAVNHLMSEDIEFYRLLKDKKRTTTENEILVMEFKDTFKGTKIAVMHFLSKYSKEEAILDASFFFQFNELVEILLKRIQFEEKNLYRLL